MTKKQDKHAIVNWGICTNTGVMEDGKPRCMKSQNKEKQAIRSSKDFVCEECGEPLTKIPTPPPPTPWHIILCIAAVVIGLVVGGYFLFRSCSNSKVQITVVSENETMGAVKGGGKYERMKVITIEAIAYDGYRFKSWDDGNTKSTREVLTKEDVTYTAQFERIQKPSNPPKTLVTITVMVNSFSEGMGTVSGGGSCGLGETISIQADAYEGYEFDSWNDGNIENPRTVITGRDETYVAKFKKKGGGTPGPGPTQYSIGKYVGEIRNGIPEGNGRFYYSCRVQIAKHDTDNPPHYAEPGDWFDGTWGNGDIVSGALYGKDGKIKEKIFAPKRFNPYDLHKEQCQ